MSRSVRPLGRRRRRGARRRRCERAARSAGSCRTASAGSRAGCGRSSASARRGRTRRRGFGPSRPCPFPPRAARSPRPPPRPSRPDEPPGVRSGSQGLRVMPHSGLSVKLEYANSGVVVFPTMIAPAPSSLSTRSALSVRHPVLERVRAHRRPLALRRGEVLDRDAGRRGAVRRVPPAMTARSAVRASSIASSG